MSPRSRLPGIAALGVDPSQVDGHRKPAASVAHRVGPDGGLWRAPAGVGLPDRVRSRPCNADRSSEGDRRGRASRRARAGGHRQAEGERHRHLRAARARARGPCSTTRPSPRRGRGHRRRTRGLERDAVITVAPPDPEEIRGLGQGSVLIGFLAPLASPADDRGAGRRRVPPRSRWRRSRGSRARSRWTRSPRSRTSPATAPRCSAPSTSAASSRC